MFLRLLSLCEFMVKSQCEGNLRCIMRLMFESQGNEFRHFGINLIFFDKNSLERHCSFFIYQYLKINVEKILEVTLMLTVFLIEKHQIDFQNIIKFAK